RGAGRRRGAAAARRDRSARGVRAAVGARPCRAAGRRRGRRVRPVARRGPGRPGGPGVVKILAIRGCNLASLAGEFEIDLARGPLGEAGVFAIVGNTGSGKSTLLDALCVALFDRTPRLTNHSTVKVGRGSDERALLGAQDVRTL